MKQKVKIVDLALSDVSRLAGATTYYDGQLFFADNITSVPHLSRVFKVRFIAFVVCMTGKVEFSMNGTDYELHSHDALFVDASTVVHIDKVSDDCSCKVCAFSSDVGFRFINKGVLGAFMRIRSYPVVRFSDAELQLMLRYYELAIFKMKHPELGNSHDAFEGLLKVFALDMLTCISRHLDSDSSTVMRQGDRLFRRFVLMLATGSTVVRSVAEAAQQLCVTPKYLTSVCRQCCNQTAGELITASMVARIKDYLLNSDLTIKEIAAETGFDNISFFGKYVKKHLGHSPVNYRKINNYGK